MELSFYFTECHIRYALLSDKLQNDRKIKM